MRFYIKTFGCKLNQAESDELAAGFLSAGWEIAGKKNAPDKIIINACAVTLKAERESHQAVFNLKRRWPKTKIYELQNAQCLRKVYVKST